MEDWLERTGILEEGDDNDIRIWWQEIVYAPYIPITIINSSVSFDNEYIGFWTPSAGARRGSIDES